MRRAAAPLVSPAVVAAPGGTRAPLVPAEVASLDTQGGAPCQQRRQPSARQRSGNRDGCCTGAWLAMVQRTAAPLVSPAVVAARGGTRAPRVPAEVAAL